MTAKRFTIGDRTLQEVYECCIPAILDGGIPCTQSQVLKLLNELHEENQKLRKENNSLISGIRNCAKQGADFSTEIWESQNKLKTINFGYYEK